MKRRLLFPFVVSICAAATLNMSVVFVMLSASMGCMVVSESPEPSESTGFLGASGTVVLSLVFVRFEILKAWSLLEAYQSPSYGSLLPFM